ncbi:UNVERIFIED_CONTAM: riboflavin biosynthesis pyrimidine reductase [Williamsia faeni]
MNDSKVQLLPSGSVDIAALAADWYGDPPVGVRANMVTSLDGQAAFDGRVGQISGATDQALLKALRIFADVVLVGAGTVRAENYGPVVLKEAYQRVREQRGAMTPPQIAVVTTTGGLPETSRLRGATPRPIIITTTRARARAADCGADVIAVGDETVDLTEAVAALKDRGMKHILCEGGPTLLDALAGDDLVDELCLTVAPKFAGLQEHGQRMRPANPLASPRGLTLAHALSHDDFLFLRYVRESGIRLRPGEELH